jgi:hypothetical protein
MMLRRGSAGRLRRLGVVATLVAAAAALLTAPRADAQSANRVALVIGSSAYETLPPLPACGRSAHAVADTLRAKAFTVVERLDSSGGAIDSALGEFSRRLAEAPGAAALVYVCARAVAFNDRPFLLPISARLQRPSDVLTQGVLAKALFDVLVRAAPAAAVVALDLAPADAAALGGLEALLQAPAADGLGGIAVTSPGTAEAATALGSALNAALAPAVVQTTSLLAGLQAQLPGAVVRPPLRDGFLIGEPVPAAPSVSPPAAIASPTPTPAPPTAPAPSTAAAPAVVLPEEAQMTQNDRMQVQTALQGFGYYAGQSDGIFGPETRAAIRRYQHEIGVEMTGRLTSQQATRLVGKR